MPLLAAACADTTVSLGDRDPPRYHFDEPIVLAELSAPAQTDNPCLTADLREIYFTSERSGGAAEIWTATRPDASARFGTPRLVSELNSPLIETSPIVSGDGLTLWFGSERSGGLGDLDIWVATRPTRDAAWSPPQNVVALNSAAKDIPRPPGEHQSIMPLGSDRAERSYYAIYFAARSAAARPFAMPEIVSELSEPSVSTVDAFLTDDGNALFYVKGPAFGFADLYVAQRRSPDEPFGEPVPLADLNTRFDERDPFLSADGTQLFFSSNRSGIYEIYLARVRIERSGANF